MVKAMHVSQDHFLVSDTKKFPLLLKGLSSCLQAVEFPLLGYLRGLPVMMMICRIVSVSGSFTAALHSSM
jgi:hypothetical protein